MEVVLKNCDGRNSCEWRQSLIRIVGMKFQPTDQELILEYLYKKVYSCELWPGIIKEIDLYNYEPEALEGLYDDTEKNHNDGEMYFYTQVHKKHGNGKRISRETEKGFWKSTQGPETIKGEDQNPTGEKIPFTYYSEKDRPKVVKTQWLMKEYRLIIPSKNQNQVQAWSAKLENCVLGKVYFKKKGSGERGRQQKWKCLLEYLCMLT